MINAPNGNITDDAMNSLKYVFITNSSLQKFI